MRFHSWALPLRAGALLACVGAASTCVGTRSSVDAKTPSIPSVGAIPVEPLPPDTPLPALAQRSTVPPSPASAASTTEVSDAPGPVTEGEAVASGPDAAPIPVAPTVASEPGPAERPVPHVVLVDEPPYRGSRPHTKEKVESSPRASSRRHGHTQRPYHPAPGIVVEVSDAVSGTKAVELERSARSVGYWPFRRCYEEGLRRDQKLAGKVSLDLDVTPAGGVDHAGMASATVKDETVALCIARESAHLAFGSVAAPAKTRMDVTLYVGDEPVAVPRPLPHATELRDALRSSWPAVEQCYATRLASHPDAGGELELRFRAKSTGEIVEVAEEGDTRFSDVDVTRCVLGVYRTARLPPGRVCTSRETSFEYAMHLEARP